jgi:hypothetical protein
MIPARTSHSQTCHNKAFAGSNGLLPKRQFNRFVTLNSAGAAARGADFFRTGYLAAASLY